MGLGVVHSSGETWVGCLFLVVGTLRRLIGDGGTGPIGVSTDVMEMKEL